MRTELIRLRVTVKAIWAPVLRARVPPNPCLLASAAGWGEALDFASFATVRHRWNKLLSTNGLRRCRERDGSSGL